MKKEIEQCDFEIVVGPKAHGLEPDKGTVKGGRAECPRCHTVMSGDEVKGEAQKGRMEHRPYCVCVKRRGLGKVKWEFRLPSKEELEAVEKSKKRLEEKIPEWENNGFVPNEDYCQGISDKCSGYGVRKWSDLFNPRQLLTHLTYLEKFKQEKK